MKNAKQKQRGIVGSGGKLINHGDTEITKRGKRKLETGNWRMERGFTRRRGERGGKRKKKKKKRKFETVAQRSNESTCTVKEAMPHATQAAWEAARETPAGSPIGQDERERTSQHARRRET